MPLFLQTQIIFIKNAILTNLINNILQVYHKIYQFLSYDFRQLFKQTFKRRNYFEQLTI